MCSERASSRSARLLRMSSCHLWLITLCTIWLVGIFRVRLGINRFAGIVNGVSLCDKSRVKILKAVCSSALRMMKKNTPDGRLWYIPSPQGGGVAKKSGSWARVIIKWLMMVSSNTDAQHKTRQPPAAPASGSVGIHVLLWPHEWRYLAIEVKTHFYIGASGRNHTGGCVCEKSPSVKGPCCVVFTRELTESAVRLKTGIVPVMTRPKPW